MENNNNQNISNNNQSENKSNNLTEIDKKRLLEEARLYSQAQMKIPEKKSINKVFMYIVLFVLLILLFYVLSSILKNYMLLKAGM